MTYGLDFRQSSGTIPGAMPYPASVGRRAAGLVVDLLVYYVLVVEALVVAVVSGLKEATLESSGLWAGAWELGPAMVLGPLVVFMVRDLTAGRSLGKWLTGTQVVESDASVEKCAGAGALLRRQLTAVILPIEMLMVLVGALAGMVVKGAGGRWWGQGRRLGDLLADTVVVEEVSSAGANWLRRVGKVVAGLTALMAVWMMYSAALTGLMRHSQLFAVTEGYVKGSGEIAELVGTGREITRFVLVDRGGEDRRLAETGSLVEGSKSRAGVQLILEGERRKGGTDWRVVAGFYVVQGGAKGELKERMARPSTEIAKKLEEHRAKQPAGN